MNKLTDIVYVRELNIHPDIIKFWEQEANEYGWTFCYSQSRLNDKVFHSIKTRGKNDVRYFLYDSVYEDGKYFTCPLGTVTRYSEEEFLRLIKLEAFF